MIIFGDICCRLISSSLSAAGSSESLGTLAAGCYATILELCAVHLKDLGQEDDRQEILSACTAARWKQFKRKARSTYPERHK